MEISEKDFSTVIKIYMGGNGPSASAGLVSPCCNQNYSQQATSQDKTLQNSVEDNKAERIWVLDDLLSF